MALLEITLQTSGDNRAAAAGVYAKYKQPFLDQVPGATSKTLLVRDEDVQVLHGFTSVAEAAAYLASELFTNGVLREVGPLLDAAAEVRVYDEA
jgi:hypothetical protein